MLLAAVTYYPLYAWLGQVTQPGNINYPVAIFIIVILVCYVGMVWTGRGVSGRILPRQDSLHVGVGAVPYRQRLGRRLGAVHHHGGLRLDGQPRLRTDLPDRGSRGVLRARPLPDAGDASYQHLEAGRGQISLAGR